MTPTGIYPENFVRIGLNLAEILRILKKCLFVCLLTGLFFYLNHLGTPTGIYPEDFVKIPLDLAEILRIRKLDWKMFFCLFICLFVYIFVCFFFFNHHRIPKGSFPQNFVKIRLDLAEILRISKLDWEMFICLFVCLFVYIFVWFLGSVWFL